MKNVTVAQLFGIAAEVIVGLVVAGFMFTESMNFFYFAFPPEQQNLAWLGLGLTGGGMIGYFIMLKTGRANTPLKKVVTLIMIVVCTLGELTTAGYGAQVEALKNAGLEMTAEGIKTWVLAIRILGLFHAVALVFFLGGDDIIDAFADKNNNGIPDGLERKKDSQQNQNRQGNQNNQPRNVPMPAYNQTVEAPELKEPTGEVFTNRQNR